MYILTVNWDFVLLWSVLTITAKIFLLSFVLAVGYIVVVLTQVILHIQVFHNERRPADINTLAGMKWNIENVQQLIFLLFLLFGTVSANEMFAIFRSVKYSAASLSALTIGVFEPITTFTFVVFCILMLMHVDQWVIARRLQSLAAKQADGPSVDAAQPAP